MATYTVRVTLVSKLLPTVLIFDFVDNGRVSGNWIQYMQKFAEWFAQEEHVKADLSRIPKNMPSSEEIRVYDAEGSFRKIAID